jgi:hypothetical protein
MPPLRAGPALALAALGCFALAAFLLVYKLIAAILVAGLFGLAGLVLLGLGAVLWKAEAAARQGPGAPRPPSAGPEEIRDVDGRWKDGT